MNEDQPQNLNRDPDLVDEVRAARRAIVAEYGNDVDRLCDHLQQVEHEYASRTGRFADVSAKTSTAIVDSWGGEVNDLSDPLIDGVNAVRGRVAKK